MAPVGEEGAKWGMMRTFRKRPILVSYGFIWLRGLDLNQRPLGYEGRKPSVSIRKQGTGGNPVTPLGTAGNAYWGPYGD